MHVHVWRRQHGPEFTSQVEPLEGADTWRISVCLTADPDQTIITAATSIRVLHSAQAKADALARKTFDHTCAAETCGVWHPIRTA